MVLHKRGVTPVPRVPDINGANVFIIAGQSNAGGQGTRYNKCAAAGMLGNDYQYKQLRDPVDSIVGQVDTISIETTIQKGSVWPVFAADLITSSGAVVYFVPCATGTPGHVSITEWQPDTDHQDRSTLYGSMVYRALQAESAGGVLRAVLWWQGENDASTGMAEATYNSNLDTVANAVNTDLGIGLMACKLQTCTGISQGNQDNINNAIGTAWADNANVLTGPDLTGLTSDDTVHLQSNSNIDSAAALWLTAIETAFGW